MAEEGFFKEVQELTIKKFQIIGNLTVNGQPAILVVIDKALYEQSCLIGDDDEQGMTPGTGIIFL